MVDSDLLFRHILEYMQGGVVALDGKGHVRAFNPAAERMLGLAPPEAGQHPFAPALFDDSVNDAFAQALLDAVYEAEVPHNRDLPYHRDGEWIWLNLTTSALWAPPVPGAPPEKVGVVALFVDITERKAAEAALLQMNEALEERVAERTRELDEMNHALTREVAERTRAEALLAHLAEHDALTGLANRRLFEQRLETAVDEEGAFALLYLDLDGFKAVNDGQGHAVGDWILKEVALRLQRCIHGGDTLARLGGDEFAIIVTEEVTAEGVDAMVRRIHAEVSTSYERDGGSSLYLGVSVGVALHPAAGVTPRALLQVADKAMYEAKNAAKNAAKHAAESEDKRGEAGGNRAREG